MLVLWIVAVTLFIATLKSKTRFDHLCKIVVAKKFEVFQVFNAPCGACNKCIPCGACNKCIRAEHVATNHQGGFDKGDQEVSDYV